MGALADRIARGGERRRILIPIDFPDRRTKKPPADPLPEPCPWLERRRGRGLPIRIEQIRGPGG